MSKCKLVAVIALYKCYQPLLCQYGNMPPQKVKIYPQS